MSFIPSKYINLYTFIAFSFGEINNFSLKGIYFISLIHLILTSKKVRNKIGCISKFDSAFKSNNEVVQ